MLEFWKLALDNLEVAGVGFAIFAMAYISNMSFSLYYNIKINRKYLVKKSFLIVCLRFWLLLVEPFS